MAATTATTAAVAGATRARSEPRAESLLELAARVVAEHYPYECIEKRYRFIPEVVQRRILFWSFPRDESYIRLYSSISSIFKDDSYLSMENFSFSPGSNMPMIFIEEQQQQQAEAPMDLSSPQQQSQSQKRLQNTNSSLFNLGLSLMHFRAVHQVLQVGKYNHHFIILTVQVTPKAIILVSNCVYVRAPRDTHTIEVECICLGLSLLLI